MGSSLQSASIFSEKQKARSSAGSDKSSKGHWTLEDRKQTEAYPDKDWHPSVSPEVMNDKETTEPGPGDLWTVECGKVLKLSEDLFITVFHCLPH